MANNAQITFKVTNDKSLAFIMAKNERVELALEAMGAEAEKFAIRYIDGDDGHPRRVDTGNLKNSIRHSVDKKQEVAYVGTNVEYALAVHEGNIRMTPNRYLRDAVADHAETYQKVIEKYLKG